MLSSLTLENAQESKEVKQRITKKLAASLRALQIRYVATDDVVSSDDDDANALCVALEAVFIHGLKAKFIKAQTEKRNRRYKGRHAPLPQTAYWALLKAITHRNVISELERVSYINTDVGRCRSWLRLALNDCLMECYFISLQREKSWLTEYYQPFALLLDAEGCDVVLSYLQGLASLTFSLSYKSSILNEWTATPLSLAGLWVDDSDHPINGQYEHHRRKSLDSVSQSSSSDDTNSSLLCGSKMDPNSSSLQFSSSLCSEGLPHNQTTSSGIHSGSENSSCDADSGEMEESDKSHAEESEFDISPMSGRDSPTVLLTTSPSEEAVPQSEKANTQVTECQDELDEKETPQTVCALKANLRTPHVNISSPHLGTRKDRPSAPPEQPKHVICQNLNAEVSDKGPAFDISHENDAYENQTSKLPQVAQIYDQANGCIHDWDSCQASETPPASLASVTTASKDQPEESLPVPEHLPVAELPKSQSWISEDDFQKPEPSLSTESIQNGNFLPSQPPSSEISDFSQLHKAFNVVHRRQIGLSNPFRGLLMMGDLERRTLGMYKSFYCELTPIEFRMFLKGEDRVCLENFTLIRCESVGPVQSDGRFELHFPAKRLHLRAPSGDEAQDWVERIREALQKCRPQKDDTWEVLQFPDLPKTGQESPLLSPQRNPSSPVGSIKSESFDWACPLKSEPGALKEAVLYMKMDKKWTRCIFSLTERELRCFQAKNSEKVLHNIFGIEMVRDILPDASLGSPSCFKLVTSKGSLQLQAESSSEAKHWREMVRDVCLELADELALIIGTANFPIKSHIREHALFQYLLYIPSEKGLDSQNVKCAACQKQIGFQFGKAKRCAYSALYYCEWCHQDEGSVIPSRMVHNWDLTEQAVSKPALKFLNMVLNEPIINVMSVNSGLYQHSHTMHRISRSRERLRLLAEYLQTCRSGVLQELSKSLDNRTYLLECAHTYSVQDLRQIASGAFESFLGAAVDFAIKHVYDCDLCSQKGFICQICNQDEIIYPFQFETTTRCGDCKSVYHIPCKAGVKQCPRCLRRKKYQHQDVNI
ncbi:pleckstrin homology domain-containing family M member 1 [Xenopus laevis]|uniref:Pleckstrin homology domain-containing family M member 1 n=2 Tax=Xenopus laevis TaxID=8355 RepID=A0A974H0B7_XENLA|nr:pleckstrin homology domain-containing family M member 1 [Xenopus laevis]OCT60122.1 hypothetical protein XELAEV_18046142mg [Xenopus laevis]